ncbi:hypothetical protein CLAFUW4_00918 [Fulvia fulva]|uniref:Uncharacterized protein n=1 Tax=Passalora fulva TaxID=5499 RepID=A0A9Q8L8I6_PASFU|nr:uncharacterized protein CLAFUR5_00923 [Fulvia fulva]KAK4635823.1 hypothetical protein CLAFUR4_00919 [Fulvia fulva]KAK4638629.1 hypothetical protein CLAFUR0_00919 [Fulvia fulva]UJO12760.1 hypothetical protein CLAFUR5_00923 [Fulvia fulva]WPV08625.1 hypothetical protein CLAFUW4_00918 [Fulvia fulva]WPV24459.1 hypothetical protein CLAFUW7_00898 [Fulvia fulva]
MLRWASDSTFFYPETKGKTLEQMGILFGDQLVPHALEDPEAAAAAEKQLEIQVIEKTARETSV